MFLDDGHLSIRDIAFTNLPKGCNDKCHQRRLEGEYTHLRGMLEKDAPPLADGHPSGRTVRDIDDVGGNLRGQPKAIQGIGTRGSDAHSITFSDRFRDLLYRRQDNAAPPSLIHSRITINPLGNSSKHAIFA